MTNNKDAISGNGSNTKVSYFCGHNFNQKFDGLVTYRIMFVDAILYY